MPNIVEVCEETLRNSNTPTIDFREHEFELEVAHQITIKNLDYYRKIFISKFDHFRDTDFIKLKTVLQKFIKESQDIEKELKDA